MAQRYLNRNRAEVWPVFVGLEFQQLNSVLEKQVYTVNPRVKTVPEIDLQLHRGMR